MVEKARSSDWNHTPGLEVVLDVSGGVNTADEDYILKEDQLAYLSNGRLNVFGKRYRRQGCQSILAPGLEADAIEGWVDSVGNRYLTGLWDGDLWKTDGVGTWTIAAMSAISMYTATPHGIVIGRGFFYNPASTATFAQTMAFVYGLAPVDGTVGVERALAVSDEQLTHYHTYRPKAACWWQGRMWIGNLAYDDGHYPDTLAWSQILDGNTFDIAINNIRVDADQGDEITRIMPARSSQPRLYIFKKHSVHALDVVWSGGVTIPATENTLDTVNSQLVVLSASIGCVAPMTVVYSSGSEKADIMFLAADGLRSMARVEQDAASGAGVPMSAPIQDVIDRINWAHAEAAWAQVFDKLLYLALPVDGATVANIMVLYDLEKGRWVGEHSFVPTRGTIFTFANQGAGLFGVVGTGVTDVPFFTTNPTFCAHLYQLVKNDWYTDGAYSAVEYCEITRGMVFGNYGAKKRWNWVDLMLEPATTAATMSVYGKVDEAEWELVGHVSVEPEYLYPILPAPLPWIFTSARPAFKRLGLEDLMPGNKLQIKVTSQSPAPFAIRATRTSAWPLEETWE